MIVPTLANGVAHRDGHDTIAQICISADFSETVGVVEINMWTLTKRPNVALAAALNEDEARFFIKEIQKAIDGMKRWHSRRPRGRAA